MAEEEVVVMKFHPFLDQWRLPGSLPGEDFGGFCMPGPCGQSLKIIASSGGHDTGIEWEHVSVSLRNRCPNWQEMCFVKDLFWDEEDAVMQLHVPKSEHINCHPYCLHLWKPKQQEIPMPPRIAV